MRKMACESDRAVMGGRRNAKRTGSASLPNLLDSSNGHKGFTGAGSDGAHSPLKKIGAGMLDTGGLGTRHGMGPHQ